MRMFVDITAVYLHLKTENVRMQCDGLVLIVGQLLIEPLMSGALFVFTNRIRKFLRIILRQHWLSDVYQAFGKRNI